MDHRTLDHHTSARVLLGLLTLVQGAATLAIDLNHTHASNPLWLRHARFHLVWQSLSTALLSLVGVAVVWSSGPFPRQRFYLGVALASVPLLAFLIALISRKLYGGSLSDPNGIPQARLLVFGKAFSVDGNLAAVMLALVSLMLIMALYRW